MTVAPISKISEGAVRDIQRLSARTDRVEVALDT